MPDVTRSQEIAALPSVVWRQLAGQDALRRWMLPGIEIDLHVGGRYRALGSDGRTGISGTVLEFVPEGRLVLSWLEADAGWLHPARLVIELEPIATGTRVHLRHDGFAGIGTDTWESVQRAYEAGADEHRILDALAGAVRESVG